MNYEKKYAEVEKWAEEHDEDPRKIWKNDINNWSNCGGWDSYCKSVTGLIHYLALDLRDALKRGDTVEIARLEKEIKMWSEQYEWAHNKRKFKEGERYSLVELPDSEMTPSGNLEMVGDGKLGGKFYGQYVTFEWDSVKVVDVTDEYE